MGQAVNPGKVSGRATVKWMRFLVMVVQNCATVALDAKARKEEKWADTGSVGGAPGGPGDKSIGSYWGIPPEKVTKEDGTEWRSDLL
ncbi:alternative oxidase [Sarracenia purpurea var. burkii]